MTPSRAVEILVYNLGGSVMNSGMEPEKKMIIRLRSEDLPWNPRTLLASRSERARCPSEPADSAVAAAPTADSATESPDFVATVAPMPDSAPVFDSMAN